ncbi:PREDICTED: LOW QUALITY PROTEIN: gastrula zinc finger protein XlCGF52.1-like [Papilio xuthus]|uniref:LOW QUALITY PROTEIN: gastrula zinc finger protein XlCGF52.1-like n=1 Tax=Papilio xuthus TaxID=66420 RepID=A0AAJ6Z1Y6_PAPXU|nr:PREDICTED: LOW QUALITY PROTEIN: gastrula zinc finger protein XlCGF52.1-like [Papilio xuthus]
MTLSERQNAAILLENTTITPFENAQSKLIFPILCKICERIFTDINQIREHLISEHRICFTSSGNGVVVYNLTPKNGQFSCHVCDKLFQTFILLNRHLNVHFCNAVCEICGAGFITHQRLLQHKEIHSGGYPCTKCNKIYTTNSNLKYHIEKNHQGGTKMRTLRCTQCSERFTEHFRKLKHLKEVHGITFTFECEFCKLVFPSRRSLTMHTNKYHSIKTQCEVCKKNFSCITTLKKHMVSHTGERNFGCKICDKSYRHQKSLKQHMQVHDTKDNYTCSDCGNNFPNRNEFNKHMKDWHRRCLLDYNVR